MTAERWTPASRSQRDREEKISRMGSPALNPKKSMVTTRGWAKFLTDSQVFGKKRCRLEAKKRKKINNVRNIRFHVSYKDYKKISKSAETA